ncbi:hypothetical protein KDH_02110 [Dictyobacter sp. S3.2.2.5]|uniref:EfeO-type cupredoxin-like domain-containing protein n=1 Tax=Dictyobacter halimunensis TaxID=3026934 RepID=A0ABQ6FIE0_9CHLR|nr:hypothetical protein KDH_02110 [Dictyobacter sp. S3.2.2.5]
MAFCLISIIVFLLIACETQRLTSDAQYTPHTRAFTLITIPLLVKESATTFDFLHKDFAKGGVLGGKEVYTFSPDHITVYQGDKVDLTIVNPEDDNHTFTLRDFGVDLALAPQATTKVSFVASKVGSFTFYCNMASHMPFMSGQLIVLRDSSAASS